MKNLKLLLSSMMFLLSFSSISVAMSATITGDNINREVGAALRQGDFSVSGDIYMEYDYFLANQAGGLDFDAGGKVFFLPTTGSQISTAGFTFFADDYGVAFTDADPFRDFWITEHANLNTTSFVTQGNIYVVKQSLSSPVPVPEAAWLFASALSVLGWRRVAMERK